MIEKVATSSLKLGIISGGQLGKMLIQEASKLAIATYILDPDPDCPAKRIATVHTEGDFLDFDTVYAFGKEVDILTYEMENINIDALLKLKADGFKVVPDPEVLALIQDKGLQKEFYLKHNIPTSPFTCYENSDEIRKAIEDEDVSYDKEYSRRNDPGQNSREKKLENYYQKQVRSMHFTSTQHGHG